MNVPESTDIRPLVLHVVYRFDVGGLENGIVNLIDQLPPNRYRHAVLALTEVVPGFAQRIQRPDVSFHALDKPPGQGLWLTPRLVRLFRELKPAIVHTRNLAALECQPAAWLAGVPVRLHGEHGRDIADLDGSRRRYRWLRRACRPLVQHWFALSGQLAADLRHGVGVPAARLSQVANGVDLTRFHPAADGPTQIIGCPFDPARHWIVGSVGRMAAVKDPAALARAVVRALELAPELRSRLRLVMVGDGPLRWEAQAILDASGVAALAWLPGERDDVPGILRGLHCFALPSRAEGFSNTILEAMATALPVIATRVGGNAELVRPGVTGELIAPGDFVALAQSLMRKAADPHRAAAMGRAGRADVERQFSLPTMVAAYDAVYAAQLLAAGIALPPAPTPVTT